MEKEGPKSYYEKLDKDDVFSLNLNKVPVSFASVTNEADKKYIAAHFDEWDKKIKPYDKNEVSIESKNEFGDEVNVIPTPLPHPTHDYCMICKKRYLDYKKHLNDEMHIKL